MESLTDESVDTFYSCLLCQSFAPNHVCVITPERLGLCGAYNWLDGKAAYEIDPTGPNQPLIKGECLDPVRGQWDEHQRLRLRQLQADPRRASTPTRMLEDPMTSCGCFEAIVALLPECNGVMIVNREYLGETPAGMKFSTLANTAGGGQQVPGFIGVGKAYITSRKFISAEGGHRRIVWMPKELKRLSARRSRQSRQAPRHRELHRPDRRRDRRHRCRFGAGLHGEGESSGSDDVGDHHSVGGSSRSRCRAAAGQSVCRGREAAG